MKHEQRSFSLLELIVCLGILAALASILLDNFADVKARECESHTRERGNQVRNTINGTHADHGISAFLSDMGRFPSVYIPATDDGGDGDGGRRLAELYDPSIWYRGNNDSALQHTETVTPDNLQDICQALTGSTFPADDAGIALPYPEISMNVGWNGPYLSVSSPVKGNVYDGWGNAWKIISNYNLKVSSNHLVENTTTTDGIEIHATETEVNALRDVSNNTRCRIDGIISYGANNQDDSAESNVSAADADQTFLFPHNMDNHGTDNLATLTLSLKLRDQQSGEWISMPAIATWQANRTYAKGDIVVAGGNSYCCATAHDSGSTFSETNWIKLSTAEAYAPGTHGDAAFNGLCIYQNTYYLKNNANAETAFTPANWLRIAGTGEIPDSISILLFTPVMQGSYNERTMHLGYYHFFRNASNENEHGVKPVFGATSPTADIDCEGNTTTIYASTDDYNARYLVAEDHSPPVWNEYVFKRLIPGKRKLFCIIYNSSTQSSSQSHVESINLKPGNNYVTLKLERKR